MKSGSCLDNSPDQYRVRRAEEKAIAQMKMYLSSRYNVENIFRIRERRERIPGMLL
ncbi:MAG: hypothetical protein V8S95_03990 [Odoribacter sp.]